MQIALQKCDCVMKMGYKCGTLKCPILRPLWALFRNYGTFLVENDQVYYRKVLFRIKKVVIWVWGGICVPF